MEEFELLLPVLELLVCHKYTLALGNPPLLSVDIIIMDTISHIWAGLGLNNSTELEHQDCNLQLSINRAEILTIENVAKSNCGANCQQSLDSRPVLGLHLRQTFIWNFLIVIHLTILSLW